ncbi:MAG: O-antigen ligase family protein [Gemmataceae bacterium]
MHWLLVGYMFLFIDRPFEVWPILGDWHIERVYMVVTLLAWLIYPSKRFIPSRLHLGVAGFAVAVVASWALSPWMEAGQPRVEDWFKILVFYVLLVTTVHDERGLRTIAIGFMTVMALYLLHSFKEYLGGRFTYRMGISRMMGVDSSLGDPNSFGATIVFALPFITMFWKLGTFGRLGRFALSGYFLLSVACILLTGSRSSLLGLMLWCVGTVFFSPRRWMLIPAFVVAAPMAFLVLPDSLQTRFETIVNPDVGPENAKTSGEGRIEGLIQGYELWNRYPLTGAGPGAWRPATRSSIESHSLPGQLVGEMGTLGLAAFLLLLYGIYSTIFALNSMSREMQTDHAMNSDRDIDGETDDVPPPPDFSLMLARAVGVSVLLLLFMGLFGHNLFRFSWLWYAGFLVVARLVMEEKQADIDEAAQVISLRTSWKKDDISDDEPIVVELADTRS